MERMDTSEDDDFQAKSQAFLTWLQEKGATISPKIELADLRDRNAGRGVVAKEALAEDEELFNIPRSSILTLETTTLPSNIQQSILSNNNDPWLSLIIGMVLEYLKGADSPWKPYFDILPETFDTLMFWSEAELELLQGSAVIDKIGKETADATFQEQLIPTIGQVAASLQLQNVTNSSDLLTLCHRMGSTIMAYAFDLENPSSQQQNQSEEDDWEEDEDDQEAKLLPKGMIPLADMLNANADLNNAKLFYESNAVVMKTLRPVKAGEELYNDFGALPRADLLRRYGYVTEKYAKYDVVEIAADLIKEHAKKLNDVEGRWAYADEVGALDDGYDIARAEAGEEQFPEELCVLLNLLVTPKAEFDKLKRKDKLPQPDLTTEAKKLLRTILVHRYAQYPGSLSVAKDESISEHRRAMAAQVIEGEKQVLREAVAAVTDAPSDKKKRAADTLEDEVAAIRNPTKK